MLEIRERMFVFGALRYEFTDTGDALTLRLGDKGATLEERKQLLVAVRGTESISDAVTDMISTLLAPVVTKHETK
ncbi:MAG: hypothetical protein HC767_09585 [Akkermansiaceae bacterium]|nr:hypothetical protein [Akkermansiaceae bacterium]